MPSYRSSCDWALLGIIEKCSDQACQGSDDTIHYLPHHAIIRTDKQTTKLRIVYDALARDNGPSLNDCLFSGLKFDQNILDILDILLRFRTYKIALTADIEKAFLMVSILELVPDMSTQTFLRSFKRFTARRGTPVQVISDNANTFVSAAQCLTDLKVRWSFNLKKAPWWGGFFKRMV